MTKRKDGFDEIFLFFQDSLDSHPEIKYHLKTILITSLEQFIYINLSLNISNRKNQENC